MQIQPVDLPALFGTVMGLLVVLIPAIGFTLRFALKPLVEVWAKAQAPRVEAFHELQSLSARVAQLEQQLAQARLAAVAPVQTELPIPVEVRGATRS